MHEPADFLPLFPSPSPPCARFRDTSFRDRRKKKEYLGVRQFGETERSAQNETAYDGLCQRVGIFRLPLVRCKYKHCSDVQSSSFLVFQSGQLRASWLNFLFQRMFMLSCCYRRDAGFVEATLPFRILTYYTSHFLFRRPLRGFTFLLKMMKMYFFNARNSFHGFDGLPVQRGMTMKFCNMWHVFGPVNFQSSMTFISILGAASIGNDRF